jgi:putative tryptophan/tyrosine transport system substrate-binding protein
MRGLAKHGYVPGKTVVLESRGADGHMERLPQLVAELAASKVEAIIALGYPTAHAAKDATALPIVEFSAGDPVATGLAVSLARPGGNVTGISDVSAEVTPKRLELLKQVAPKMRRVAMLWNADDLAMTLRYQAAQVGGKALGITVQPLGVREPADFDHAFEAMERDMPDAILMVSDPLTNLNRKGVFEFAAAHRLPAIYEYDFIARSGGLMSYGLDLDESFDRLGGLVDRVLKGAKPAELPFEEPTLSICIESQSCQVDGIRYSADVTGQRRRGHRMKRRTFIPGLGATAAWSMGGRGRSRRLFLRRTALSKCSHFCPIDF